MNSMRNVVVTAYVDGRHRMCRLTAELPEPNEAREGLLRRIRIALTENELQLWTNAQAAISDLTHHVHVLGDDCLFFDLDFPANKHGVTSVPYYRVFMPWFVRKIVARLVRRIWSRGPQDGTETRLEFDERRLRRWVTKYGTGSGGVHVATDELTGEYLAVRLAEPGTDLGAQLDHLKRVAVNTTRAKFQSSTLVLSKDRDGFYFRILNPRKRATLDGGVIDHGAPGKPAWSLHT